MTRIRHTHADDQHAEEGAVSQFSGGRNRSRCGVRCDECQQEGELPKCYMLVWGYRSEKRAREQYCDDTAGDGSNRSAAQRDEQQAPEQTRERRCRTDGADLPAE